MSNEALSILADLEARINEVYWDQGGIGGAKTHYGFDEEEISEWASAIHTAISLLRSGVTSSVTDDLRADMWYIVDQFRATVAGPFESMMDAEVATDDYDEDLLVLTGAELLQTEGN